MMDNFTPMNLGFNHFIQQADGLSKALLIILLLMSMVSWSIIFIKMINGQILKRKSRHFLHLFWQSNDIHSVQTYLEHKGVKDPFANLAYQGIKAVEHHGKHVENYLRNQGTRAEFLTRTLRHALDDEQMRSENGLTLLATVAATAPFVGLFGTVWGIYHALIAISLSGAGTIDKVAGPVGEALIMTGIGLAVAIPAVMAYNIIVRRNRLINGKLEAFAFELLTFLGTGECLKAKPPQYVK